MLNRIHFIYLAWILKRNDDLCNISTGSRYEKGKSKIGRKSARDST